MRLKQCIFALVAMLLCAFSATAQVTTEAALKEALTAGGEVTLGADINVAEMIVVPNGVTATLDLNGHAITSGYQPESETKHIYPLDVNGDLTIKDTKGDGSITGRGIYVRTGGKLTVDGGYIYGIDANGGSALFQYGGDIVINGGHIEQKATGTTNFAVNAAGGTVKVYGGWVGGNHGAIAAFNDAAVTIYDGTFVCTGTAGMTDNVTYTSGNGSITINGGKFIGDSDSASGGCCVYDSNGKTTVNGGTYEGTSGGDVWGTTGTTINGGTFENLIETQHVAVGATITNGGKTYTKAEDGTMVEATIVEVATYDELVAALANGGKIKLTADITVDTKITAIDDTELDLNEKTLYINVENSYYNNVTIKNGNIVIGKDDVTVCDGYFLINPGKTLVLDGVNMSSSAEGIKGYAVFHLKTGANLDLLNSTLNIADNEYSAGYIVYAGEATATVDIVKTTITGSKVNGIVHATTVIDESTVTLTNVIEHGINRSGVTIDDSNVAISGGTGRGITAQHGDLVVTGNSTVDIRDMGEATIELRNDKNLSVAETATVTLDVAVNNTTNGTISGTVNLPAVAVAKVNGVEYATLAEAVAAVEDGGTITMIANETFTENNRYNNGGWWDGLGYSGDKSFTIDLNNFTISQDGALNDYLMWFKNDGAKDNTITLKNGTLDAGTTAYCALATASSNAKKITVNLENISLINNKSDGATLKIRGGAELNVKAGTVITGKDSYLGIEAVGSETVVNIYDGAKFYMNGTSSYNGCLAGVSVNGTINVYGGEGQSKSGGFIAMTSGGTINIEGGEWIANTDGAYANSNKSVLVAQSEDGAKSIVNVTGGTFKGGYNCYGAAVGDAQINISGGNFNADPATYLAQNYVAVENNGVWNVELAVAKIGDVEYTSLQAALDAAAAGTGNVTVTILSDVNLTGIDWNPVTVSGTGYPLVTVEGNYKTITGLNDMLFAGTWAGNSGIIIKNLTIADSEIVNDKEDAVGTVGVGAFIGFPQASATITLENCHLKNSSVEGGHWTGGLIGYAAGYAGEDGPVFMNLTVKNCSVTGSTITGKGSVGGIIGHGSGNGWTNVVIEETTVKDNTITSTGSSTNKAGAIMGTIGAAGQPTTANGVTKTGGASVSATVAGNTVKSNNTEITTIYGRQGTGTGMLYVAGGSYDNYPIEPGVAYAAPVEGYEIVQNTDGTYGIQEAPAYVAKIGDVEYTSLQEAIEAAEADETITLIADVELTETLNIPAGKTIALDLNGKTISQTKEQTAGYQMILNDGNLTIDDSSEAKTGKISYTDSGNGGEYISDVIYNRAVLVINGGTIENLSSATVASNGYPHAVDTYSGIRDTYVEINGGTIYCAEYSAIRMFCVSATNKADLVINDGTIKGAIDMQNGTKNLALGTLTINGGTFETTKNANNIRFANWNGGATEYGISAEIKGGSFNGGITTAYVPAAANWDKGVITGGTFAKDMTEYCAEGFVCEENENGTYGIVADPSYIAELLIDDANPEDYTSDLAGMKVGKLTYKRTFTAGIWNPMFVPFEIDVERLVNEFGLEVASYNQMISSEQADGSFKYTMEVKHRTSGKVSHYPLFVRTEDSYELEYVAEDVVLSSADEFVITTNSVANTFKLHGTHQAKTKEDLAGMYAIGATTGLWAPSSSGIKPHRLYFEILDNSNDPFASSVPAKSIRIVVEGEDGTTGVDEIVGENGEAVIFDLQGRRVLEPQKGGLYIVNGKKVLVK